MPAVVVVTMPFVRLTEAELRRANLGGSGFARVTHPLGGQSSEVIRCRAEEAVDQVADLFVGRVVGKAS